MKSYMDEIYIVKQFKQDEPALTKQAERALDYLKSYCPNSEDKTFVIIEVEGYKCVAYLTDEFSPYVLGEKTASIHCKGL